MGASELASAVVYVRIVKSGLAPGEAYREALSTVDVEEALSAFRDTIFGGVASARTIRGAEEAVWRAYLGVVRRIAELADGGARGVALYYIRSEEARDLLSIAQAVASGAGVEGGLPTSYVDWSITSSVLGDPEATSSVQRLLESVGEGWARRVLEGAARFHQESRLPDAFQVYSMKALALLAAEALEGVGRGEARGVERVLCPRLSFTVASGMIMAKRRGLEARLAHHLAPPRICGFDPDSIRAAYEREADPLTLAYSLRDSLPYFSGEGRTLESILENARREAARRAYRAALSAMAGYPFTPGFIAGGIELVRAHAESILVIARSLMLGLKPHEYSAKLAAGQA